MNAPNPTVIILPVPVAGSPGWDRGRGKPPGWQRKASNEKPRQDRWWDRPRHEVDRDAIRELIKRGKEQLVERKPLIEALLATGRAA
jgi:hypothetical protein